MYIIIISGEGLHCYTCAGASNEECNQQGSEQCPGHSDACAIIRGQSSKCSIMTTIWRLTLVKFEACQMAEEFVSIAVVGLRARKQIKFWT